MFRKSNRNKSATPTKPPPPCRVDTSTKNKGAVLPSPVLSLAASTAMRMSRTAAEGIAVASAEEEEEKESNNDDHSDSEMDIAVDSSPAEHVDPMKNDSLKRWEKMLIVTFAPLICMCNIVHIVKIVLHEQTEECVLCPSNSSIAKFFIQISAWCLFTTTATFGLWTGRCFFPKNQRLQNWTCLSFHVSLPWTIVVTAAYMVYVAKGGTEFDKHACYTVWQAAFPRDASSQAAAFTYIWFALATNITVHFLSSVVHLILFFKRDIPYDRLWPTGLTVFVCVGIAVGAVQSSGAGVYCTDNIWLGALAPQWATYALIHLVCYFKCNKTDRSCDGTDDCDEEQGTLPGRGSITYYRSDTGVLSRQSIAECVDKWVTHEKIRFSSATAGYRIIRLTLELFVVTYIVSIGHSVTSAGTIFLIYSFMNILVGLAFFRFPTVFFGQPRVKGLTLFGISLLTMIGGFIGMFTSTSYSTIALFAALCGAGTAGWFVNYQTIANCAFRNKSALSQMAHMRQGFECIGFLLPSICLAVVNSNSEKGDYESIIQLSSWIVGFAGLLFFLISADVVIRAAVIAGDSIDIILHIGDGEAHEQARTRRSTYEAVKTFVASSVFRYFCLSSILLEMSNLLFGTVSIVTEEYFGLPPTFLWLMAIGVPIGGMVSVGQALIMGTLGPRTRILIFGTCMLIFFSVILAMGPVDKTAEEAGRTPQAKTGLFFFGFVIGFLYSETWVAAFALRLQELKMHSSAFVARATTLHSVGVQAILASVFQLQTFLLDQSHSGFVLFGPQMLLIIACIMLVLNLPPRRDEKFDWPIAFPGFLKVVIRFLNTTLGLDLHEMLFGKFSDFRSRLLSMQLSDSHKVQRSQSSIDAMHLCAGNCKRHLEAFKSIHPCDDWWHTNAELKRIVLKNEAAMENLNNVVRQANATICIMTWSLSGKKGDELAERLIERSSEGVEVRIIVDCVNLHFLSLKGELEGGSALSCFRTFHKLLQAGVEVRMMDTWHEETGKPYVVGTHRKLVLADDRWLLTGGRNLECQYLASDGFHYRDLDVILQGDFEDSTRAMFQGFWERSKSIVPVINDLLDSELDDNVCEGEQATDGGPSVNDDDLPGVEGNDASDHEEVLDATPSANGNDLPGVELHDHVCDDEEAPEAAPSAHGDRPPSPNSPTTTINSLLSESDLHGDNVDLFQLDHKAGNLDGLDVVYDTLLFMIDKAETSIDLVFGYFQLFPDLEDALMRAKQRGVRIRVLTNSSKSNDLDFYTPVFSDTFERLVKLGIDVYVPTDESVETDQFCLHYKFATFDSRAILVGSWNCLGTSVFHDDEFSIAIFDESGTNSVSRPLQDHIEELLESGTMVPLKGWTKGWQLPLIYRLFVSKEACRQTQRTY